MYYLVVYIVSIITW